MKKVAVIALVLLLSVFAFAQKITVQIEGSAVPYYIPIYMGIELGYFAEEGLEVDYLFGSARSALLHSDLYGYRIRILC